MKKLIPILLLLLFLPQFASANESISPKYSSLSVSPLKNPTYPEETFNLILNPKTSHKKQIQTPKLGDKVYLYAEEETKGLSDALVIEDNLAKTKHYLREVPEVKGLYLLSTNKLKGSLSLKASFKKAGNYTLYAVHIPKNQTIEAYKIPNLKDRVFLATPKEKRSITIKIPTFDGFMAINASLLDYRLPTMVIAQPFEESIKRNSLPIDEHGEKTTELEVLFYDKKARPVQAGAKISLDLNSHTLTTDTEEAFTDEKGSVHLTLKGAAGENDTLTFYLDNKRVALPLNLKPYSLRPKKINFNYNKTSFLVDGKEMPLAQAMILKNNRTYLPLRAMSEAINAKSFFEPKAKVITTYYQNHILTMTLNATNYTIDNQNKVMDAAPFVKNGYTLVPIRFVANEFGYEVKATKTGVELSLKGA